MLGPCVAKSESEMAAYLTGDGDRLVGASVLDDCRTHAVRARNHRWRSSLRYVRGPELSVCSAASGEPRRPELDAAS
jgi:hypothetical protein